MSLAKQLYLHLLEKGIPFTLWEAYSQEIILSVPKNGDVHDSNRNLMPYQKESLKDFLPRIEEVRIYSYNEHVDVYVKKESK